MKPRVSGYLQSVHFRDGDYVRRGQLLFTIDQRPALAQVEQARAQVARAEATLANARTELARSRALAAQRAASVEEVEQRQAALRAGQAEVAAARANLRAQSLTLGFTRVLAPISGRISDRRVDPGNAVTADDTMLTTDRLDRSAAFRVRRLGGAASALSEAGRRPARKRGPDPSSGRSRLRPCRPARLRRPGDQPGGRDGPRPGDRRQSRRFPAARA